MAVRKDPARSAARHDLIVMHMDFARRAIWGSIERLHPRAGGCLPLPDLEIPDPEAFALDAARSGQMALRALELPADSYDGVINAVFLNLFTPDGKRHQERWTADHPNACPHMPHSSVRAVFELIHKWYGLLAAAAKFRDAEPKRADFEHCLRLVRFHINNLDSLPAAQMPAGCDDTDPEHLAPGDRQQRADELHGGI